MKVDVIEIYPNKDRGKEISGTANVYIVELDLGIKGVIYQNRGTFWFISLPMKIYLDENGEKKKYPVIWFHDKEKKKDLDLSVRAAVKAYIEENLIKSKA